MAINGIIDIIISTILLTMYYYTVFMFCYDRWLCMVINISTQYNGGFLPDIIMLTQGYYHWGTRLNTMMQWLCIYSLCNSRDVHYWLKVMLSK